MKITADKCFPSPFVLVSFARGLVSFAHGLILPTAMSLSDHILWSISYPLPPPPHSNRMPFSSSLPCPLRPLSPSLSYESSSPLPDTWPAHIPVPRRLDAANRDRHRANPRLLQFWKATAS